MTKCPACNGPSTDGDHTPMTITYECPKCAHSWEDFWCSAVDADECPICYQRHVEPSSWERLVSEQSSKPEPLLDRRQLAAVLAGLRIVQAELPRGEHLPHGVSPIFDDEGEITPLTEDEIDDLCEILNEVECAKETFQVEVAITDHYYVTVEAKNEDEARRGAENIMAQQEEPLQSEFFSHSDGFDAVGCERVSKPAPDL